MKMWNDPNPVRRRRNRLIVLYIAVLCGSFLLSVIARMVGFSEDAATYLLFPAAFLLGLLLPFVFWMVALTRRAKAWEKDQRALAEARETQEQLKRELRAQGKLPIENARGRNAGEKRLTAKQWIAREYGEREAQSQRALKFSGRIVLATLIVGLIGLILYMSGKIEIGSVLMFLGLLYASLSGLFWLLERSTLRDARKEREFLEQGGSFEEMLRRRNRSDALFLVPFWIAALVLFLLNTHFRSLGNETATQATNVGLLFVLLPTVPTTFLTIKDALKNRKERREREQDAKEARLVEEEYSRETGASWLMEKSPIEKEYGRNAGERWVTALAGSVEDPFDSRVDLARREDGWVVRETRAEGNGLFTYVAYTTSHRLAKGYFANHSEEDFLAQLAQWFPERNFDGVRNDPAVRALFAGGEPELAPEAGVEWIERLYSENNGGILYPVDLVRVGPECFVRDGSFDLTQDGARGVYTCSRLGARYLRERTVADLIWDVEADLLLATHRRITSEEKQRLRESPRLRALFDGKRSISSDGLCRWLRLYGANGQTLPSIDLLERASGWTFVESLTQDDARRLDLPADCLSPKALPRTLASVAEAFPEYDEAQSRAALAAALSAIGEADDRVAELYSRNSESGSDVVIESLDLHRDSSGRFFLRHRFMRPRLIPSESIEILPLPEDYFRAHAMEEFIKTARRLCFKEIDAAALRRNPALQALFGNSQPNPAPQPQQRPGAPGELDDMSYIKEMRHSASGAWQQYDVVLDARPYGWEYMVDEIDELAKADLDDVSTLKSEAFPGAPEAELIDAYHAAGNRAAGIAQLANEGSTLAIGGFSRTMGGPVMVVLFNQTNLLRVFVIPEDEERVRRYAETLIRRSFNTPDAMKLGRPHAQEN